MEFDTRVGAYAVIVINEQVLLTHWVAEPPLDGGWTLPGGGLEQSESPQAAAVREVREETGFEIELTRLLGTDSVHISAEERAPGQPRRALHSLRIIYEARISAGELKTEADGSTDDARWTPLADVSSLRRVSLVDAAIALWGEAGLATAAGTAAWKD